MATYAIGDVQGCFTALQQLLRKIAFNPLNDRLWFVGDLVNRGPQSLETLRFVRGLGDRALVTLGNHDLHLLTVAEGCARLRKDDTLSEVLSAPDRDELLFWLRHRPLMHVEDAFVLLHAGLVPQWSIEQARTLAGEVEQALRADDFREFLAQMYGDIPDRWDDNLTGYARLRVVVNALTRMRICSAAGVMQLGFSGATSAIPPRYFPWFDVRGVPDMRYTVICGHWSALGLHMTPNLLAIDTGCLWGGRLTAVRLPERTLFQAACS